MADASLSSASLGDFLLGLAEDPARLEEYKRDQEAALSASGLSAEDQEVLRSNDPQRIKAALGDVAAMAVVVIVIVIK
jgi:hypothetical protein